MSDQQIIDCFNDCIRVQCIRVQEHRGRVRAHRGRDPARQAPDRVLRESCFPQKNSHRRRVPRPCSCAFCGLLLALSKTRSCSFLVPRQQD